MDRDDEVIVKFYKKRIEPFIALFILVFLITGLFLLYEDNQLKKKISMNCGYETEDYVCYCESSDINAIRIRMNQSKNKYEFEELNISKLEDV